MFINLTKQDVALDYPIDNSQGCLKVAIHEMFYKVKWFNICEEKKNNFVKKLNVADGKVISKLTIPEGYYNICELEQMLNNRFNFRLDHSNASLKVELTFEPEDVRYRFARGLASMLGFKNNTFDVTPNNHIFEGDGPIDLEVNSPLYVYLSELDTAENFFNGKPSTILKVIPSGRVSFCERHVISFTNIQFKRLVNRHIEKLCVTIKDRNGEDVVCDDLFIVLEITN